MKPFLLSIILSLNLNAAQLIPNSHPDIQWAVVKLQTCAVLDKILPTATTTLAKTLPTVIIDSLPVEHCARFDEKTNFIILNSNWGSSCNTRREVIAHELLHYLGFHHHYDVSLLYTLFDDVHQLLISCLGEDYHFKTKQVEVDLSPISPFKKGNGQ